MRTTGKWLKFSRFTRGNPVRASVLYLPESDAVEPIELSFKDEDGRTLRIRMASQEATELAGLIGGLVRRVTA
jgi:hypothetical protein